MILTDGFMLVDKPAGMTSHDVVAAVRRATGVARVGHTGTLDPFATGLLVILIGRATRLAPYVSAEPKSYDATIAFGRETTTDDATGETRREAAAPLALDDIVAHLPELTGEIDQVPPEYSAKKVQGRRAYEAARRGTPLQLQPARVRVDGWRVHQYGNGVLNATITCGSGTYIRSLARDLGRLAGTAAHLAQLRRTRSGTFDVADAVSLDAIRGGDVRIRPAAQLLADVAQVQLSPADAAAVAHGREVPARDAVDRVTLLDPGGRLLAVAEREGDAWRPRVVLADA